MLSLTALWFLCASTTLPGDGRPVKLVLAVVWFKIVDGSFDRRGSTLLQLGFFHPNLTRKLS